MKLTEKQKGTSAFVIFLVIVFGLYFYIGDDTHTVMTMTIVPVPEE